MNKQYTRPLHLLYRQTIKIRIHRKDSPDEIEIQTDKYTSQPYSSTMTNPLNTPFPEANKPQTRKDTTSTALYHPISTYLGVARYLYLRIDDIHLYNHS